jgi:hypothetical protein
MSQKKTVCETPVMSLKKTLSETPGRSQKKSLLRKFKKRKRKQEPLNKNCVLCGTSMLSTNMARHLKGSCPKTLRIPRRDTEVAISVMSPDRQGPVKLSLKLPGAVETPWDHRRNSSGGCYKPPPSPSSSTEGEVGSPLHAMPGGWHPPRQPSTLDEQIAILSQLYQGGKRISEQQAFRSDIIEATKDTSKLASLKDLFANLGFKLVSVAEWDARVVKATTVDTGVGMSPGKRMPPLFGFQLVDLHSVLPKGF